MIIPGQSIEALKIISPFTERSVFNGMSYGAGPAGYDVRIATDLVLKPGHFALGVTVEHFNMPSSIIAFVHDKSTWARRGLSLFNTVIEPGWCGYLTLELVNESWRPLDIPAGSPIAQIIFHRLEEPTSSPYSGKYQDQPAVPTKAIMEKKDD